MKAKFAFLILFVAQFLYSQNIVRVEYFIDVDPGYGNGTPVLFTAGSNITLNFVVDLANIPDGLHFLFVRAKDSNGRWSLAYAKPFQKAPLEPRNITIVEYFFSNDSIRTPIQTYTAFSPGPNIDINFDANLSGLGLHNVYHLHIYGIDNFGRQSLNYIHQFTVDTIMTVGELPNNVLPKSYSLKSNYPNPFNPATTIQYQIPTAGAVQLIIYNVLGQSVRTLVNEKQPAGYYQIRWDGKNQAGHEVTSGLYIYRFQAGGYTQTRQMQLLK